MSTKLVGKPSPSRLEKLLVGCFGAPSRQVIVGPGAGLDAAVLDLEDGRVMVVAEDPIFPAPGLPLEIMGQFTVHIGASDVAVTGVKPSFMAYTLLLPRSCPESDARTVIEAISRHSTDLGITIVGGHTGWYDAVTVPTVGGVTVWGWADCDQWVSPGGARDGDEILLTKGPAIEACALLAILYQDRLQQSLNGEVVNRACARTDQITVVRDALTASACGGVHAMHDATEGGVIGGLWEMAHASGLGIAGDLDHIPVPDDIAQVSQALGFDPWEAISEGTLLVAVAPDSLNDVTQALLETGTGCWRLGRFTGSHATVLLTRDGRVLSVEEPTSDPFWPLFFAGIGQVL